MTDQRSTSSVADELSIAAEPSKLAELRRQVVELARRSAVDDDVVRDLELAASELATNVIQHTDASQIQMTLRREPSQLVLEVAGADGLDGVDPPVPDPAASSGRGLFIVRAVMDDVQIINTDDGQRVRCVKRVS